LKKNSFLIEKEKKGKESDYKEILRTFY